MGITNGKMKGAILPGNSTVELKRVYDSEAWAWSGFDSNKSNYYCGSDIRCIYREHLAKGPEGYIT